MTTSSKISSLIKSQGFTLALLGAVLAAIAIPEYGMKGGILKSEVTTKIAVALTFLIQGLSLPTRQIAASATKVKLHFFSQFVIFILAPILMMGYLYVFGWLIQPEIRNGFMFLAILPTTISSAIVMTSNSDGDTPTALFSTTISNVMGIAVSPILCALLGIAASDGQLSLGKLIAKLALYMLLPLIVGQLIRPYFRETITRSKALLKRMSNGFIVFIVFAAFSESVINGVWQQFGIDIVAKILIATALFLILFSAVVWTLSRSVTANVNERIALFFCGSQKTLAAGIPMASLLFVSTDEASAIVYGLTILPLMCYHPLQLVLAGFLSPILAKKAASE